MKTIVVIADNYPSNKFPAKGTFVSNIVREFGKHYNVVVISPIVLSNKSLFGLVSNASDSRIDVRYPRYLSFSNLIFEFELLYRVRNRIMAAAVVNQLRKIPEIHFIYCHFLSSAISVLEYVNNRNIPLFVALGESSVSPRYDFIKKGLYRDLIQASVSGFVAVSDKLARFAENVLGGSHESILISPNATNEKVFYKFEVKRKDLGLSVSKFLDSFDGAFIERKGIDIIVKAAERLPEVGFILIGKGALERKPENIYFCGQLMHSKIPTYLNATDAFIFPSQAEGSSNAIAEAMACGLPIISSDIPEITYQVGKENGIFINPNSVEELVAAILRLKQNPGILHELSQRSIKISKERTIERRAMSIIDWIENKIER